MVETINAMEDPQEMRRQQRIAEARDLVNVVNLGFKPGTRITYQQEVFVMPEKGKSFRVPRRYADKLIRSHRSGALAFENQVGAVSKAMEGKLDVPPGFAVVTQDEANMLADLRNKKSSTDLADEKDAEVEAILDEID